ncbi:MAG: dihydroneopterin aldolase [Solitalea-like symbiont of Acarus siro]
MAIKQFIEINNFKIFAYHGFYDEEQKLGNWFRINLKIGLNFLQSAQTDSLADTLNYEKVFEVINLQMQIKSRLLEHAAMRIAQNVILLEASINYLKIKIEKLLVPIDYNVESTAIELELTDNDLKQNHQTV